VGSRVSGRIERYLSYLFAGTAPARSGG
jgi:hypothetical protein